MGIDWPVVLLTVFLGSALYALLAPSYGAFAILPPAIIGPALLRMVQAPG